MDTGRGVVLGITAALVALLAVGLGWLYTPSSGPPLDAPVVAGSPSAARSPGPGRDDGATSRSRSSAGGGSTPAAGGADGRAAGADAAVADGAADGAAAGGAPRKFATPADAEDFVAEQVLDLFAVVAPELDRSKIEQTCSGDGRACTFVGPWPGDDFTIRWIRAISEGRTGLEAMDGVTFSKFEPIGEGDDRQFVIEAKIP